MKKAFFIALLALMGFSSFGQKIRFSDSTNVWTWYEYFCAGGSGSMYEGKYIGDTTYHGVNYKILQSFHRLALIREDSIANKIYGIRIANWHSSTTDTSEHLLYDYTLNVGDTFRSSIATHFVSLIDSVLINGQWHKTWQFLPHSCAGCGSGEFAINYNVIEGVGSDAAPLTPLNPKTFERCISLTCFHNKGTTPLLSSKVGPYFNNSSSCSLTFGVGVQSINSSSTSALLSPNPIDNTTKIAFPYNISGSMLVLNSIGQVIVNMPFTNEDELLIGGKITVPGLYYYRVTDEQNGKVYSGKFVKQ